MKRIIPFYILLFLLTGSVSGCENNLPKPETKPKIIAIDQPIYLQPDIVPVYNQNSREIPSLFVQHKTNGNQVLVECILNGISFRESDQSRSRVGKMIIWVDGRRDTEVNSAAFIIKGLRPGGHKIKLEVVKLNNEPYGLAKEFMVNIPR